MTTNAIQQASDTPLITTTIELATPQTIPQADMLEALEAMSPQQRTEIMADWYLFWTTWHTQYRLLD